MCPPRWRAVTTCTTWSAMRWPDCPPKSSSLEDLCAVCAVDVSVVDDALAYLGCTAEVITIDPHAIEECSPRSRGSEL